MNMTVADDLRKEEVDQICRGGQEGVNHFLVLSVMSLNENVDDLNKNGCAKGRAQDGRLDTLEAKSKNGNGKSNGSWFKIGAGSKFIEAHGDKALAVLKPAITILAIAAAAAYIKHGQLAPKDHATMLKQMVTTELDSRMANIQAVKGDKP